MDQHLGDEDLSAAIFLRTRSGKSVRDLKTGPLPENLDEYRPPEEAIDMVRRNFEARGFKVFDDPLKLLLYLNAPASLFVACFGVLQPHGGDVLKSPEELYRYIEEIVVMRSPEWV